MAAISNSKTNVLGTQKMVRLLFTLAITLSAVNQVNQSSIYLYLTSYNACIFSLASNVVQSVCSFALEKVDAKDSVATGASSTCYGLCLDGG